MKKVLKVSELPGIIKYGSIRAALRDIAKKTETLHNEFVRKNKK